MTRQEVAAITRATRQVHKTFGELRLMLEEMGALWKSGEIESVDPLTRAKAERYFVRQHGLIKRVLPLLELYLSPHDG